MLAIETFYHGHILQFLYFLGTFTGSVPVTHQTHHTLTSSRAVDIVDKELKPSGLHWTLQKPVFLCWAQLYVLTLLILLFPNRIL